METVTLTTTAPASAEGSNIDQDRDLPRNTPQSSAMQSVSIRALSSHTSNGSRFPPSTRCRVSRANMDTDNAASQDTNKIPRDQRMVQASRPGDQLSSPHREGFAVRCAERRTSIDSRALRSHTPPRNGIPPWGAASRRLARTPSGSRARALVQPSQRQHRPRECPTARICLSWVLNPHRASTTERTAGDQGRGDTDHRPWVVGVVVLKRKEPPDFGHQCRSATRKATSE